ncbi:kinase-like domain-containing protein [Hyaloraphidium curvatum]|nr:kinase-like domain-containing protein [Hyaloraphidium curvatum]
MRAHRRQEPANLDLWRAMNPDFGSLNILVFPDGVVKYADFGAARVAPNPFFHQPLETNVVTLPYRAPELLLGAREYRYGIDAWALGCSIAALLGPVPASCSLRRFPRYGDYAARIDAAAAGAADAFAEPPAFSVAEGERAGLANLLQLLSALLTWEPVERADVGRVRMWSDSPAVAEVPVVDEPVQRM